MLFRSARRACALLAAWWSARRQQSGGQSMRRIDLFALEADAAGRELRVLIDHLTGCQSCPGKHRSVGSAPCLCAGTTGHAAGLELTVLIDHLNPSLLLPCPRTGGSRVGPARASEAGPATAGEPKSVLPKCSRTFGDVESSCRFSSWYKGCCRSSHCISRPAAPLRRHRVRPLQHPRGLTSGNCWRRAVDIDQRKPLLRYLPL